MEVTPFLPIKSLSMLVNSCIMNQKNRLFEMVEDTGLIMNIRRLLLENVNGKGVSGNDLFDGWSTRLLNSTISLYIRVSYSVACCDMT